MLGDIHESEKMARKDAVKQKKLTYLRLQTKVRGSVRRSWFPLQWRHLPHRATPQWECPRDCCPPPTSALVNRPFFTLELATVSIYQQLCWSPPETPLLLASFQRTQPRINAVIVSMRAGILPYTGTYYADAVQCGWLWAAVSSCAMSCQPSCKP